MADEHAGIWSIVESIGTVAGAAGAGLAAAMKWFTGKHRRMQDRINQLECDKNTHATRIAVLEVHHQANLERLGRIEVGMDNLNKKQDRQTELLVTLVENQGRLKC